MAAVYVCPSVHSSVDVLSQMLAHTVKQDCMQQCFTKITNNNNDENINNNNHKGIEFLIQTHFYIFIAVK